MLPTGRKAYFSPDYKKGPPNLVAPKFGIVERQRRGSHQTVTRPRAPMRRLRNSFPARTTAIARATAQCSPRSRRALLLVVLKNELAGSHHDVRHPGEFAFNAAPAEARDLSLCIVRPMLSAVNHPRVQRTKMLWVLP